MSFSPADYSRGMQLVQTNPTEAIRRAKANSNVDLKCIANCIQSIPELQTPTVIHIFVANLAANLVPDITKPAAARSPVALAADRAFASIMGLGNMGPFLQPSPHAAPFLEPLKRGWPGIWKWMQFFYYKNLDSTFRAGTPEQTKNTNQMISYAIYSMTHDDDLQRLITSTDGVIPVMTKLWLDEERVVPGGERANAPLLPVPVSSAALHQVLFEADDSMLDQVVANSFPGQPEKVASFLLTRLRAAVKKPAAKFTVAPVQTQIDLSISFSRAPKHPLRRLLLEKGLVGTVTKALLVLTTRPLQEDNVLEGIISCFGCISNLVECGDGVSYIRQMLNEDFLQAFVNVMPFFQKLDEEARSFTIELIEDMLPRYLVYRSIIEIVVEKMRALDTEACKSKVARSPVKESWYRLKRIAEARMISKQVADDTKKRAVFCDHCQRAGPREAFKQCTGCKVTLYCSKECQVAGWRKQHREECSLKDQERICFKSEAITKQDRLFHHALTIREARILLPTLRNLAQIKFPGVPLSSLGIKMDYTRVPPVPDVFKLDGHDMENASSEDSTATMGLGNGTNGALTTGNKFEGARSREAQHKGKQKVNLRSRGDVSDKRYAGILKKAQVDRDRLTLIESVISGGKTAMIVLTLSARNLWIDGDWEEGEDEEVFRDDWVMKGEGADDGDVVDLGGKLEEVGLEPGLDLD